VAVECPFLDPARGFAVDPHTLVLRAQQELVDVQDTTEKRELERLFSKEDRRGGAQQDSWPKASSARQMQPSASNLD
jgi:signal transduction histidine kinase